VSPKVEYDQELMQEAARRRGSNPWEIVAEARRVLRSVTLVKAWEAPGPTAQQIHHAKVSAQMEGIVYRTKKEEISA
jgi:hypothetical protein